MLLRSVHILNYFPCLVGEEYREPPAVFFSVLNFAER